MSEAQQGVPVHVYVGREYRRPKSRDRDGGVCQEGNVPTRAGSLWQASDPFEPYEQSFERLVSVVERECNKSSRGGALRRIDAASASKMALNRIPVTPTFGNRKRCPCLRWAQSGTPSPRTRSFSEAGASDIAMT